MIFVMHICKGKYDNNNEDESDEWDDDGDNELNHHQ